LNNINKTLTLTNRREKGNCSAPPISGDDMDETHPC